MKKILTLITICQIFIGCAVTKKVQKDAIQVSFMDEYILPADLDFQDTRVGGLSGIDFENDKYFLVCDQSSDPRIYIAKILIENRKFKNIEIQDLIGVQKSKFPKMVFDLEAINYDEKRNEIVLSSEGLIDEGKDPAIFTVDKTGDITGMYQLPSYFSAEGDQKPRNNGVFEGLSLSHDQRGYWVATELPLEKDGAVPKIYPTRSHIRITKFDKNTGEAMKQFTYKLDGISKLPINFFAINGLTEIIEYANDKFLILERAYSAGYGPHGNTVKIFDVNASNATNTLAIDELKGKDYQTAEKSLIFNFKSIKDELTDGIIDNIEGMCFGPDIENGKKSLILVSDNNFNSFSKQLNQFILLELDFKK